jgi:hypothetical protein
MHKVVVENWHLINDSSIRHNVLCCHTDEQIIKIIQSLNMILEIHKRKPDPVSPKPLIEHEKFVLKLFK